MDLTIAINSFLIFVIYFVIYLLIFISWWLFVLGLYLPSFRLRKLKKLIREDNMEYNEILAEKSRVLIEKANTQLQYDNLVIQKSKVRDEIKELEKEQRVISQQLQANADTMNMLNEFLNTPDGKKWLSIYAVQQSIKNDQQEVLEVTEEPAVVTNKKKKQSG